MRAIRQIPGPRPSDEIELGQAYVTLRRLLRWSIANCVDPELIDIKKKVLAAFNLIEDGLRIRELLPAAMGTLHKKLVLTLNVTPENRDFLIALAAGDDVVAFRHLRSPSIGGVATPTVAERPDGVESSGQSLINDLSMVSIAQDHD